MKKIIMVWFFLLNVCIFHLYSSHTSQERLQGAFQQYPYVVSDKNLTHAPVQSDEWVFVDDVKQRRQSQAMSLHLNFLENKTFYTVELWDCQRKNLVCRLLAGRQQCFNYDISDISDCQNIDSVLNARFKIQMYQGDSTQRLLGKSNYLHIEKQDTLGVAGKIRQMLCFRSGYSSVEHLNEPGYFILQACNDCNLKMALQQPPSQSCLICGYYKTILCCQAKIALKLNMNEDDKKDAIISMSYTVER